MKQCALRAQERYRWRIRAILTRSMHRSKLCVVLTRCQPRSGTDSASARFEPQPRGNLCGVKCWRKRVAGTRGSAAGARFCGALSRLEVLGAEARGLGSHASEACSRRNALPCSRHAETQIWTDGPHARAAHTHYRHHALQALRSVATTHHALSLQRSVQGNAATVAPHFTALGPEKGSKGSHEGSTCPTMWSNE